MTKDEANALVWEWVAYFQPEFRAVVLGATLALAALWLLVFLKVADRVH